MSANREALEAINAARVEAGVCRHCGRGVPCWSLDFGDAIVGSRWTKKLRERAVLLTKYDRERWRGTRETGVMPNTAEALVEYGWLRVRKDGGRLVYRLTRGGELARDRVVDPVR